MGVSFCEQGGMLYIAQTADPNFKNRTKGLLGTWNDYMDDDFTLQNGTVLSPSASEQDIHFQFGLSCKY